MKFRFAALPKEDPMPPTSPSDAMGRHAVAARELIVDIIRSRHDQTAEAHAISGTRYAMGFGSQWRDLLDDTCEAFTERGFQSIRLKPAGYKLPVINDSIAYVWRKPAQGGDVGAFANSPTRRNGFSAAPPPPMLFEPTLADDSEGAENADADYEDLARVVRAVDEESMPLVLVVVQSTPTQLQSISWAIATLDMSTGEVSTHGTETIWEAESITDAEAPTVESFDSGPPAGPTLEPRPQEETDE